MIHSINSYVPLGHSSTEGNACVIGVIRYNIGVKDIVYHIFRILGRGHEHTRPDRDQFVTINWENILPGKYSQLVHQPMFVCHILLSKMMYITS